MVARYHFHYHHHMCSIEPYGENSPTTSRGENVSINGFWNLPPLKIFQTQLTDSRPQPREIQWPLQNSIYYIALYFPDNTRISRSFNIAINNITYYSHLNVSRVALFANQWRLQGPIKIVLTHSPWSSD